MPKALPQLTLALLVTGLAGAALYAVPNPAILAAFGLAPFALLFAFAQPFLLCLLFIVFSFFRIHEAFPVLYPLHIPQLLALGALSVLGILFALRRLELAWSRELKLFAIFFALITVGVVTATGRDIAMAYWIDTYVKIAIMVFAIATLARSPRDFSMGSHAFVLAGMLVGSVALYNSVNAIGLVEGTRVTISRDMGSVLGDPNDLSLVLLFPLSFAAALVLTPRMAVMSRLFGIMGTGVIIPAIIATQSRGGLLGIVAVFGTFAARRIRSKALLITIGACGLVVLFVFAGIGGRASGGAAESGAIDESSMGRLEAWKAAFRMAVAHPLTGVGLNNYVANFYFYSDWWEGFAKAVHSTWFSVLSEGGFIAFGIFIMLVVRIFIISAQASTQSAPAVRGADYSPAVHAAAQAVLAGMSGFVISGTFLTQGFTWPVYILLALGVAVSRAVNGAASRPANFKVSLSAPSASAAHPG
jgi:putative inorganic carbon (hco3(-)) transporter